MTITGKPTKCSGKTSRAFTAKDLMLLERSNIETVFYSAVKRRYFADGESISKIV